MAEVTLHLDPPEPVVPELKAVVMKMTPGEARFVRAVLGQCDGHLSSKFPLVGNPFYALSDKLSSHFSRTELQDDTAKVANWESNKWQR